MAAEGWVEADSEEADSVVVDSVVVDSEEARAVETG